MASSPYDENVFATANTFTNVLHSTPQQGNTASLNLEYDQSPGSSEHNTMRSAEISIEIGRGPTRGVHDNGDLSSNAMFTFGNENSQFEVAGTPHTRARTTPRRSDGTLRKEAAVRRATESSRANDAMKRTASVSKKRAVSDNALRLEEGDGSQENTQPTATFQVRGSRFSRQISSTYTGLPTRFTSNKGLQLGQEAPQRRAAGNATVQSATYTAQSFLLPDIPNITELVSGAQTNGTPVAKRGPVSRSRFTSTSYKPQPLPDIPVTAVRVPEDEKAIYAGIQLLHDRNVQLENAHSEAMKRVEGYENEITNLRKQLSLSASRTNYRLDSEEDDTIPARTSTEYPGWQTKIKAMQDRLDRAERKISISEITASRIAKERDALITQVGTAYFNSEELAKENEAFRESHLRLQEENEDLKEAVMNLQHENADLRDRLSSAGLSQKQRKAATEEYETAQGKGGDFSNTISGVAEGHLKAKSALHNRKHSDIGIRSKKETRSSSTAGEGVHRRRRSSTHSEHQFVPDLASRIEREVQKRRDEAANKDEETQHSRRDRPRTSAVRTGSKSRTQNVAEQDQRILPKRYASAPAEIKVHDNGTNNELNHSHQTGRSTQGIETEDEDQTELSDIDEFAVANLRRKLESERLAERHQKLGPMNDVTGHTLSGHSINNPQVPRKSSLKDFTNRTDDGTGRLSLHGETVDDIIKPTKTVRVQSPHSSQIESEKPEPEAGDVSMLSNISRRRRQAENAEGMTSAFIIPDITLHDAKSLAANLDKACIEHDTARCTICAADHSQIEIPLPVPVTDREGYGDETSATIRPAQEPAIALAIVIQNLQDEIAHLKIRRDRSNRLYNQHDPALSRRRRHQVKAHLDHWTAEIERRSDQVYKLYDVLEGQKQAGTLAHDGAQAAALTEDAVEETLQSIGLDPADISGRLGRAAPAGLEDLSDADSDELPWEGLSDVESESDGREL